MEIDALDWTKGSVLTVFEPSPSSDNSLLANMDFVVPGKTNGDNVGPVLDRGLQFEQGDVILECLSIVTPVNDDASNVLGDGVAVLISSSRPFGFGRKVEVTEHDCERGEESGLTVSCS